MAALACIGAMPALAGECKLKRFASIPISPINGQILVDSSINGEAVKLLVDTGSWGNSLAQNFVNRTHGAKSDTPNGFGLTGKIIRGETHIDQLTLGGAVARDAVFGIANLGGDGSDGRPVGLLGAAFLAHFDVEIDPGARRMNLFSQDHCPGSGVYWAKEFFRLPIDLTPDKHLTAQIEIDGKVLHGLIDTGASVTTMRLAVARAVFDISPDAVAPQDHRSMIGADGTKIDSFTHSFKSLRFGDITLHDTKVMIGDIDSGKGYVTTGSRITGLADQPDVIIGLSLLSRLHLFIAYSEPALYFTIMEQTAPPGN
jgi:hypothetical protein